MRRRAGLVSLIVSSIVSSILLFAAPRPPSSAPRRSRGRLPSRLPIDASSLPVPPRDFNVRSFRRNVVLRWEWRPGSTLYAVWQEDRAASEILSTRVGIGDMFRSVTAPGTHYFIVTT